MPVQIHNKSYVTVAERLVLVHESGKTFEVIESQPVQVGDRWIWRAIVLIDGMRYTGNAEVKLNARAGSPDATDPWACGETSAIGRAIAWAGFGAIESIASADEIVRHEPAQPQTVKNTLEDSPASEQQLREIARLANALDRKVARPATYKAANELLTQLSREYNAREAKAS